MERRDCFRVGWPRSVAYWNHYRLGRQAMSQVRVHNFSISLDGFGTGEGLTFDAPFGHAGERLHEWMFATRFWRSMVGDAGGSSGVDHSFADRHGLGIGA